MDLILAHIYNRYNNTIIIKCETDSFKVTPKTNFNPNGAGDILIDD